MRNAKTFQIRKKLTAAVYELTVAQVLEIFWLLGDFKYPSEFDSFVKAHRADVLRKSQELVRFSPDFNIEKLSPDEVNKLIGLFIDVNKAFFNPSGSELSGNNNDSGDFDFNGFEHYQNFSTLVNSLVRLGHINVLDYPISLLNEIVEQLNKQSDE